MGKFTDLPAAENDADVFAQKIIQCGFDPKDVTTLKNVNFKQIKEQMWKYNRFLNKNQDDKKTLIVIYFAGHGVMLKNENHIVVLESEENKLYYRLEYQS